MKLALLMMTREQQRVSQLAAQFEAWHLPSVVQKLSSWKRIYYCTGSSGGTQTLFHSQRKKAFADLARNVGLFHPYLRSFPQMVDEQVHPLANLDSNLEVLEVQEMR